MRDLLGWKDQSRTTKAPKSSTKNRDISNNIINIGDEQFRMRICRADYHGALVKITKSKCPSQLGVQVRYYIQHCARPKMRSLKSRIFSLYYHFFRDTWLWKPGILYNCSPKKMKSN